MNFGDRVDYEPKKSWIKFWKVRLEHMLTSNGNDTVAEVCT